MGRNDDNDQTESRITLMGFRDEDTMFGVDTKARRELLPTTSMSGMFEPAVYSSLSFRKTPTKNEGLCRKEGNHSRKKGTYERVPTSLLQLSSVFNLDCLSLPSTVFMFGQYQAHFLF